MTVTAPLYLNVALASAGAVFAYRSRATGRLKLLLWYLIFVALAAALGLVMVHRAGPGAYRMAFWIIEILHNLVLCGLALEIVCQLLPERIALVLGVFVLSILAVTMVKELPLATLPGLLNISISADMIAGLLLVSCAFFDVAWTREHGLAAAGVALILLGDAWPAVQWLRGPVPALLLQLGNLPGLVVLAVAALRRERMAKRARGDIE